MTDSTIPAATKPTPSTWAYLGSRYRAAQTMLRNPDTLWFWREHAHRLCGIVRDNVQRLLRDATDADREAATCALAAFVGEEVAAHLTIAQTDANVFRGL